MSTKLWAANEAKGMLLNDKRRQSRVKKILKAMADNPTASIAQACSGSEAETKAAYRFIGTVEINEQDILEGHYQTTIKNISKSNETVLCLSDGMDASFKNLVRTEGLGPITSPSTTLGIKMHNTIAVGSAGTFFGLIDQQYWIRAKEEYGKRVLRSKKQIKDKESNHWLEALDRIEERLASNVDYIYIGDGGADIYDLFAAKRRNNSDLLIHQVQNRNTSKGKLFDILDREAPIGYITKTLQRNPSNPERTVKLEVRIANFEINSPDKTKAANRSTTKMHCLVAREIWSDKPVTNSIVWRLVTTILINAIDDAEKIINMYAKRWLVERFHYVLKEGSRIEKLQMESADNLKRAIALYSIVAWRIMHMTYVGRTRPDASSAEILSKNEWEALCCFHNKKSRPPKEPPSMKEAILMIAKIGGFLGRKSDGDPGAKVLWRGLAALEHITSTYLIFKGKNVGNA